DEQRNLYKALVEAYEADKAILDTYGDYTILKRRRGDDDQEGPSAGPNRGSKRQKEGGEQASARTPSEKATKGAGGSTTGSQSRQMSASESAYAEEPVQTTCQIEETPYPVFETGADDQLIVQTSQHPEWFSQPKRPPLPNHPSDSGQFGNQRKVTIARARETIGSQVVQQTRIHCFNYKEFGYFARECRKPKRVKDYTGHKEKMLLCKQAEKGVPLKAEQSDWLEDMDEEIDEQELEAHYSYMAKIQEVSTADSRTDTEPLEK
nr:hypothetical protein [Tanacetum cinerariifolium]